MIIGIGTDIVQIPRIEKLIRKFGQRFLFKILDESEIEIFYQTAVYKQASFLAKRFAAKEAISKALGLGIGSNFSFKEIKIYNNELGKPEAIICNAKFMQDKNNDQLKINLSLSDDYPIAVAFAVITS